MSIHLRLDFVPLTQRRSGNERREAILEASLSLFASHGLHGVTTRMIAEAAGISEALLYRHFRGKDELYEELQRFCLRDTMTAAERLAEVAPSTETLVRAVFFTVHLIVGEENCAPGKECVKRIMLSSLVGDGAFARGFVAVNFSRFIPRLSQSLEAAHRAGDLVERPKNSAVRLWLMHHVAVMVSNMLLPDPPVVDHRIGNAELVEEVALFSLRGLGLTEAAIARHFRPKELRTFARGLLAVGGGGAEAEGDPPARKLESKKKPARKGDHV